MHKVIKAKSAEIFPVVQEILQNGDNRINVIVTGNSMYPFLREGTDSVELRKPDYTSLKRLDIVLIKRNNGVYVLHRVCKKNSDCFYMVGDNQYVAEGPLYPDQLIASVSAVIRRQKRIPCDSALWMMLSRLWLFCLPLRRFMMKAYRKTGHLIKKFGIIRS